MHDRLRTSQGPVRLYALPLFSVLTAVALCIVFGPIIQAGAYLFLLAAVVISVRANGLRSGFLALGLSVLCLVPTLVAALRSQTFGGAVICFGCFISVGVLTCFMMDSLEVARQKAASDLQSAEAASRRFRFLAEASGMLESEYTYEGVLATVMRAVVPAIADWAVADIFREGPLYRVAISHREEMAETLLREKQRNLPIAIQEGHPLYQALLTRQPCIFTSMSEELLSPLRLNAGTYASVSPRAMLFIPLAARNRLLGCLTLLATTSDRTFTQGDLASARDLALRVATAMDNLRLYQDALDEAAELARREREVTDYSSQLEKEREDLEALTADLMIEAKTDGLTGLFNHLTFQKALVQEFDRSRRENAPLSLAMLDVDRFKSYNDTFGHPAGDQVLKQVARIMKETARDSDLTARYGGEEFVIILPDTDIQGAIQAMERLRHAIETASWPQRKITASFGVATLSAGTQSPRDLIALADVALYRSKHGGRNQVSHQDAPTEAVVFGSSSLRFKGAKAHQVD